MLPAMSVEAQASLLAAKVIVVGSSKHGTMAALYLAGAGIGQIGLADTHKKHPTFAAPESLYTCQDIMPQAKDKNLALLTQLNPDIKITQHNIKFTAHNADEILENYDLVIDGLDDWQEKLVTGDACMRLGKPLVHAAIAGFNFHVFAALPGKSACLRCLFTQIGIEDFTSSNAHKASFSPIAGMAGAFQASEAIKIIAHVGITQADEYIHFDGLRREFHTERGFRPSPDCPDCGR